MTLEELVRQKLTEYQLATQSKTANILNNIPVVTPTQPIPYLTKIDPKELSRVLANRWIPSGRFFALLMSDGEDGWNLIYTGKNAKECFDWHFGQWKNPNYQYAIVRIRWSGLETSELDDMKKSSPSLRKYTAKDYDNEHSPRHLRLCQEKGLNPTQYL